MLPYGKQTIDDDDIAAVVAALKSDFLTCGPEIEAFEQEFAALVGAKHAVVVCNATAALHLAMLVADVGVGDRVVTSPNTFLSSANCAAFVGAIPDFADIDPATYNLCPISLEQNWQKDTKAVVAVAYAGQSPDMPEIARVARSHGAIVIEDGCHGVGGGFAFDGKNYKIGGHPWADMTTFSFHPVKTMTTGEGGILVTDNAEYAAKARLLRAHGMVRDLDCLKGLGADEGLLVEQGPWMYEMQELGYNYRITDIQCALGRSQLRKLPSFIERRQEIVARYNEAFDALPWLQCPQVLIEASRQHISWHLYSVQINFEALGKSRTEVMAELRAQGVGTQVLYIPVHLQPWYRETYGYEVGKCPNAEAYYAQVLSLPLYPKMTDADVAKVIQVVAALSAN
jgi:perosamine synthetase